MRRSRRDRRGARRQRHCHARGADAGTPLIRNSRVTVWDVAPGTAVRPSAPSRDTVIFLIRGTGKAEARFEAAGAVAAPIPAGTRAIVIVLRGRRGGAAAEHLGLSARVPAARAARRCSRTTASSCGSRMDAGRGDTHALPRQGRGGDLPGGRRADVHRRRAASAWSTSTSSGSPGSTPRPGAHRDPDARRGAGGHGRTEVGRRSGSMPSTLLRHGTRTPATRPNRRSSPATQRLAAQSSALTNLMARYADSRDSFDDRVRGILGVVGPHARRRSPEPVDVHRRARCRSSASTCTSAPRPAPAGADVIRRVGAPRYFEALDAERVIAAHDARTDARTREFLDTYLVPNGICSMLDVPLRRNAATVGVLCAEHTGSRARLDARRAALRDRGRAPDRRGAGRRGAARRRWRAWPRAKRARGCIIDTAHDAFVGIDSTGPHRHVEHPGRAHVRLDARRSRGAQPGRDAHPGRRSATSHLRGMEHFHSDRRGAGRQPAPRADGAAPQRPRVPGRDHDHVADARRARLFLRRVPPRHLRPPRARRPAAAGQGVGRGGHARQERVPRQHEPRAADAAQRRARLRAAAAARPQPQRRRSARRSTPFPRAARTCSI